MTANKSLDGQYLREDARERQNLTLTSARTLATHEKACEAEKAHVNRQNKGSKHHALALLMTFAGTVPSDTLRNEIAWV
jgi:hypothetical protein